MGKIYPYVEVPELEDFEDEDTEAAIRRKTDVRIKTDPFGAAGADPFYFAAGNTKLADCFDRPDDVLIEIHALGDSMSPIPSPRKKTSMGRGGGSSFPSGVGNFKRTGTRRGYFSAPPRNKIDKNIEDEDVPIVNLSDLADKQDRENGTFSPR